MTNTDTVLRRALAAYYRAAKRLHPSAQALQPSKDSSVVSLDGKTLAHLVNINGTLAVYELNNGRIKALPPKHWPPALA